MTNTGEPRGTDGSYSSIGERIFIEAIEYEPGPSREHFLDQRCAEQPDFVRSEVRKLLAADEKAEAVGLTKLAKLSDSTLGHSSQYVGQQVGPYRLLQVLGEGGMGTVYMAEQSQPIHRTVAVKIIKPGLMSKEALARFESERQALALMDHPNIAKVLDAGSTDDGHPYFVMELIKGIPITEYCDRHKLDTRSRLELFLSVCHAVAHAHQKGIIHRDIKPSNVLLAEYDDEAVPKVIDFGVAKAVAQKLTDKTMFTRFGQLVGTFEYMSPEQAKLNQLDVDTRSDVYSLGVLLYELLTGAPPFDRQRLRSAALDELVRIICEEDPPRPSTRLTSDETAADIADKRGGKPPATLSKLLRGELDWVVMRSLEKDRRRRYQSAGSLSEDIQRYLNGEAVDACPPTFEYRVRKFVRKNRTLVVVALLLFALLTVTSLAGWSRYRQSQRSFQVEKKLRLERDIMLLVAQSNAASDSPRESAALALQAMELAIDQDASVVDTARQALWNSVVRLSGNPLVNHANPIRAMCLSEDRRWLLSAAGEDAGPLLTDLAAANSHSTHLLHRKATKARISPDQHWLATAANGSVMLWPFAGKDTAEAGKELWTCAPGEITEHPASLCFSDDSRWLVVTYYNGQVLAWDLSDESPEVTLRRLQGFEVGKVQLLSDRTGIDSTGSRVAALNSAGRLLIWDLNAAGREPAWEFLDTRATALGVSNNGRWLVTAGHDARLWDLSRPGPRPSSIALKSQHLTESIYFTADSELLALGGDDGTCCIYDLNEADPTQSCLIACGVGEMRSVAISGGDHKWLATGSRQNGHFVRLWDLHRMRNEATTEFAAPDGTRGKLWNSKTTPSITQVLGQHDKGIVDLAFDSADERLIAADWGGRILGYNPTLANPGGGYSVERPAPVQMLSVSPDGKWLVVGRDGPYSRLCASRVLPSFGMVSTWTERTTGLVESPTPKMADGWWGPV